MMLRSAPPIVTELRGAARSDAAQLRATATNSKRCCPPPLSLTAQLGKRGAPAYRARPTRSLSPESERPSCHSHAVSLVRLHRIGAVAHRDGQRETPGSSTVSASSTSAARTTDRSRRPNDLPPLVMFGRSLCMPRELRAGRQIRRRGLHAASATSATVSIEGEEFVARNRP
jgi:hypothetical protein